MVEVPVGIEQVVARLQPGGQVRDVRALVGGVSAKVFAVDLDTPDGRRRVVCRQHPGVDFKQHGSSVTAKEYHLLRALHRSGLAVPEPYLYAETPITAPYLVMEWIDGSTEPPLGHAAGAMDEMAEFLVRLHALDPSSLRVPGLEPIEDPRVEIVPHLPSTAVGREIEAWLTAHPADQPHNRPVVLHGDYWPGNVLWREGRLRAVIDWEDASLGDPLADLATARLELRCRYGVDAMDRFTARYLDLRRANVGAMWLEALPVWELYASATALATMAAWGLEATEEARRREHTQQFFDHAARRLGSDPPA